MYYLTVHMINKSTAEAKDVLMRDSTIQGSGFLLKSCNCVGLFVYVFYHKKSSFFFNEKIAECFHKVVGSLYMMIVSF